MLSDQFLAELKRVTETRWATQDLDSSVYGFQIQRGTRWLPGLAENQLESYQRELDARFPEDFRAFLRKLNGTDLPTRNIYGNDGTPAQESVGVYSYPRDLAVVKDLIGRAVASRAEIAAALEGQGFQFPADARLVPIYGHRYVVCERDPGKSSVLSIVVNAVDAIVYGDSLREYLEREFLGG